MSALVAKIVLAPAFVVGASLAARRFGPRVGGLVGGLPVVAGPILLVFALEHGAAFAAQAAGGTLLGMVSLSVFIVVYARAATMRVPWLASLLAGWAGFAAMTALLDGTSVSAGIALTIVLVTLALTLTVLQQDMREPDSRAEEPAWDLPVRAMSALALVLALTALAGHLGAHLSGLLAPSRSSPVCWRCSRTSFMGMRTWCGSCAGSSSRSWPMRCSASRWPSRCDRWASPAALPRRSVAPLRPRRSC